MSQTAQRPTGPSDSGANARGSARPTLEEVAALAGVGRGTVSRVINGSPRVSDRAREAVQAAITELGYVPNRAARTLVTSRTDSIALIVPEAETRLFSEPYFSDIISGVAAELSETDMQLLLILVRNRRERDRLSAYLTAGRVDGVLLVAVHQDDPLGPAGEPGDSLRAGRAARRPGTAQLRPRGQRRMGRGWPSGTCCAGGASRSPPSPDRSTWRSPGPGSAATGPP